MIQNFIDQFNKNKEILIEKYKKKHPENYYNMICDIIELINHNNKDENFVKLDCYNMSEIDDGKFRGAFLFIIPEYNSDPILYWYVKILYGTYTVNDTIDSIRIECDGEIPTKDQVIKYINLALNITKNITSMN